MEGVRIVLKFSCLQTHSSSRYTFIYMELNVAHNERQFRDNLEGLQVLDLGLGWVLGWRPIVRFWKPRIIGGVPSVGVFLRDPRPYLREISEKTAENSE